MPISIKYKNIVFGSTGMKVVAYAGSLQVLEAHGILKEIQNVAGTSAGAIIAALVALDYKSEEVINLMISTNFNEFEDGFNPCRVLTSYGIYKGECLKRWIEKIIVNAGLSKNATFQMMSQHSKFKNLRIFATDLNTERIQEFSSVLTPHTIIAEAIRAAVSIPLFFKACRFSNNLPNDHIYVDGMCINYTARNTFKNLDGTLGFYLFSPQNFIKNKRLKNYSIVRFVKALFNAVSNVQENYNNESDNYMHSILINDLNVAPTDFKIANKLKTRLIAQGKEATEKFFGVNRLFD